MDTKKQKRLRFLIYRQQRLSVIAENLSKLDQRFFWYRLATFLGAWAAAIIARLIFSGAVWLWAFILFIFAFLVVVFFHRRLDRSRRRFQAALEFTNDQIARLRLDWQAIPVLSAPQVPANHPFAFDLNLVGDNSLYRLVDNCSTSGGRRRLLNWMIEPELDLEKILERQRTIRELVDLPGLRYGLSHDDSEQQKEARSIWDEESLLTWLRKSSDSSSFRIMLVTLSILALSTWILFILNMSGILPAFWQFSLILYAAIYLFRYRDYKSIFEDAYDLGKSLSQFKTRLLYIESYRYPAKTALANLVCELREKGNRPSAYLKKIVWITSAASLQNNQILWLLVNLLLPWDLIFAAILNRYKLTLNQKLPGWLNVWYQLDALNALANFAFLNPEYTFPSINADPTKTPVFKARQLGHVLIKEDEKVCNDFTMDHPGQVVLITGSNMSGKSTFLRTLGINLVLAFAGAPVNAEELELCLMRLFTCIQVADSLADGFSYFYAEVHRLKGLLDLLEQSSEIPVFYLIDEIFRGTNNRERRIGSRAYVRALANSSGLGVISTHDLELANLAKENKRIHNYNFQDDVAEGKMVFDYKLREGPSPSTNALKIMELEGLPIDGDDEAKPGGPDSRSQTY